MKKSAAILALFCCVLTATAQQKPEVTRGNGNTVKENRETGNFDKIIVSGPFDVRLVTGKAGSLSVEADSNIVPLVETQVSNGTLTIAPAKGKLFKASSGNKVIVKVPVAQLHAITLNGSGTVKARKKLTEDVTVTLDGSGNIELEVENANAEANITGSGNIEIKGKADNFTCFISGSGKVIAEELNAGKVNVTLTGSGNARVYTAKAITGRITGSGSVAYSGNPKERDLQRTGTGNYQVF